MEPAAAAKPEFKKDDHYEDYKRRMDRVRMAALGYVAMQGMIWFLGVCNLTWASAVILGGLLTSLSESDFYAVTVLLVVEAVRLGLANSFARLAITRLPSLPSDPSRLVYHPHYTSGFPILNLTKYATQSLLLILIAISVVLPIRRLLHIRFLEPVESRSLFIFYSLVLFNASISSISIVFSNTIASFVADSYSLRRCFNYVACSALDDGLLSSAAASFDSISFSFHLLSEEFRRNVRPPTVYATYKDLLDFLYAHPHMKGFEAAAVALDSDDVYVRQAAANAVGSWATLEENHGAVGLLLQRRLLASLAAALDHNETGRSASYAFEIMSRTSSNAPPMLSRFRSSPSNEEIALVEILIWRVREAVQVGKPDKAIIFVKVLLHLIPAEIATGKLPKSMWEMLRNDLESIFHDEKSLFRTLAVTGKALSVMKTRGGMYGAKMKERLMRAKEERMSKNNKKKEHILKEELQMMCDVMAEEDFGDQRSLMKFLGCEEHNGKSLAEIRRLPEVPDVGRLSPVPDLVFVTIAFSVTVAVGILVDRFL